MPRAATRPPREPIPHPPAVEQNPLDELLDRARDLADDPLVAGWLDAIAGGSDGPPDGGSRTGNPVEPNTD